MWNNRFNEDDPENPRLADQYGVVMGTSHQEPMLRAQKEWDWGTNYGKKYPNWNYSVPAQQPVLQEFWREGVRRNKNFESIFTMGLRAENDSGTPMGKDLTSEILKVQRQILAEEINPDLTKVPQLWCLYKEVQDFYNEGMTVPDDVTLLWADDNWGDVRRLPTADERPRSGGAGVYYHFDYHGGPRSYQWVNTSPMPKIRRFPGQGLRRGSDLDCQRRPLQGLRISNGIFHGPGVEWRSIDQQQYKRIHSVVGGAGIWPVLGRRYCRRYFQIHQIQWPAANPNWLMRTPTASTIIRKPSAWWRNFRRSAIKPREFLTTSRQKKRTHFMNWFISPFRRRAIE